VQNYISIDSLKFQSYTILYGPRFLKQSNM